ncbi:H-type lectin domain-containing protein [Ruegeria aquimaris]|uniref:H-type lectin domain-containing protein n=1 Tax=Ruegeria aquimaris TaxID=2984333 RepID=A0ABT3AJ95_9RHOB|nr:H-type lectin domain-containing protein [Ruegeria sp. XHP0148]MCV2888694.1 H-type lectin domain-containing protein [Ruegeria sp. XHP0148]
MKLFSSHPVAIQQGDEAMFSDFENGGDMWTGSGTRERRKPILFKKPFHSAPAVMVAISLWDVDTGAAVRAELKAEEVTPEGFDLVFRTWADTRVARLRLSWTAIGEMRNEDDWDVP